MGKWYVSSGNLRVVIARKDIDTPLGAATEACLQSYNAKTKADVDIRVSERGFDKHDDDIIFDTASVLRKAGFTFE